MVQPDKHHKDSNRFSSFREKASFLPGGNDLFGSGHGTDPPCVCLASPFRTSGLFCAACLSICTCGFYAARRGVFFVCFITTVSSACLPSTGGLRGTPPCVRPCQHSIAKAILSQKRYQSSCSKCENVRLKYLFFYLSLLLHALLPTFGDCYTRFFVCLNPKKI